MIKYEKKRNYFTATVQGLSTVTCIFITIVLFSFHSLIEKYAHLNLFIVFLMMVQIFFNASYNYWIARKKFEFQYRGIVVVTIILAIGTPVLAITLMKLIPVRSDGIILGTVVAQSLVGFFLYCSNLIRGKCFYDKEIWRYCFLFNLPLIPHYLSYVVLGQADRIMIDAYCGASDAGIYSLAYQLSLVINLVTNAIDGSFNPWTYQKLKEKEFGKIRKVSTYLILIFAIGVMGLTLIAPELLRIVSPPEYQAAKWVIPPVISGCFFLYVAGTFMRVEFFHERNKIIMVASTSTAIINVLLNAVFIPRYDFIAAAYTTLFSYVIFCLFHYFVMNDTCKKQKYEACPYDAKRIALITVVTSCMAIGFMFLYPYPLIRYSIVVAILFVCVIKRKNIIRLFKEIKKM